MKFIHLFDKISMFVILQVYRLMLLRAHLGVIVLWPSVNICAIECDRGCIIW